MKPYFYNHYFYLFIYLFIYLLRQMAAHIKYTNQYKLQKTRNTQYKKKLQTGITVHALLRKKSLCPQNVAISSALVQQHQSTSYEWKILTISCHTRVYT